MSQSLFARLSQRYEPQSQLDRREFLKHALAATTGLLISASDGWAARPSPRRETRRFVVVGAGFSGLACAHELKSAGHHVTVLESRIRPALHQWLTRFDGDIWPTNADRMVKHVRARFALGHDVLRHSFFSYVVAAEKSVERAALEGGNTESILRRHYLNLANTDEAQDFWRIMPPDSKTGRKVVRMTAA